MTTAQHLREMKRNRLLDVLAQERCLRTQAEKEREEERKARLMAEEELTELLYFITKREEARRCTQSFIRP